MTDVIVNKEEAELCKEELKRGGVFFRCKECSRTGMIKGGTQIAEIVREESDIAAPEPCGIEFDCCAQHNGG